MRLGFALVVIALTAASASRAGAPVYIPPPPPEPPKPVEPPKPSRYRLLVLDLKANDVDKGTVTTLQGFVATGLSQYPELDVVSGDDVKQLVQLQAERQTMGCSEDASCLAEIADALGAQLVVFGNVGKLDNALVMNLNLFDSIKAVGLGRIVVQSESTKTIPKKLRPKLHDLVGKFYAEHGLTLPPLVEEKEEAAPVAQVVDPGPWPWVTAGTGAVLLVAGSAAAVVGWLPYQTFQDEKAQVVALQKKFAADGDVSHIEAARKDQSAMLAARDQWNGLGYILFDAGVPVAAVGLLAGAGGLVWALTTPAPGGAE